MSWLLDLLDLLDRRTLLITDPRTSTTMVIK